ncbi:MAG TPA: FAD synthetase family protein [Spirochaetia bacterium]|nr:FAD synthetase family protein [Spirochaetia bacterium]
MNILSWENFLSDDADREAALGTKKKVALTIGVFDGVHAGHQSLLAEVVKEKDCVSLVVTFTENPAKVLTPDEYGGDIQTQDQKLATLAQIGIDAVILIDFSSDFSKLSGRQFFDILLSRLSLAYVVLGSDFVCGYRGDTTASDIRLMLEDKHIPVAILPPMLYRGKPISSTRIREAIRQGDLASAHAMLGRSYILDMKRVTVEGKDGEGIVQVDEILQPVPEKGEYPVIIQNAHERKIGSMRVADGWIRYKPLMRQTMYIEFCTERDELK